MITFRRSLILMSTVSLLSACMIDSPDPYQSSPMSHAPTVEEGPYLYPEGYDAVTNNRIPNTPTEIETPVVVPETYHVSRLHGPTSAKHVDHQWVSTQQPDAYTIALAKSPEASQVANVLYTAPKRERSAEVKAGGQYMGVYGSYSNYEAAEQQLNGLPDALKGQAKIIRWQAVQRELDE